MTKEELMKENKKLRLALDRAVEQIFRFRGTIKSREEIYNQLMKGEKDGKE